MVLAKLWFVWLFFPQVFTSRLKMAGWLRAFAALEEDMSSVFNTHIRRVMNDCTEDLGDLTSASCLYRQPHDVYTHTH